MRVRVLLSEEYKNNKFVDTEMPFPPAVGDTIKEMYRNGAEPFPPVVVVGRRWIDFGKSVALELLCEEVKP